MAAIPALTAEQRAKALEKATAVRMARRTFKDALAAGSMPLGEAIATAKADDALAGIRCSDLLQCLAGVGPKRAQTLMDRAGIAASRRVRGVGEHQVAALLRQVNS